MNRADKIEREELIEATGEQAYFDSKVEELDDLLPQLTNDQLERISEKIRVIIMDRDVDIYSESLPF